MEEAQERLLCLACLLQIVRINNGLPDGILFIRPDLNSTKGRVHQSYPLFKPLVLTNREQGTKPANWILSRKDILFLRSSFSWLEVSLILLPGNSMVIQKWYTIGRRDG